MLGALSLGKRPGPDQPTSVGRRHGLVTTEPRISWSTNSRIAKNGKGKCKYPVTYFPSQFPTTYARDRWKKQQKRYRKSIMFFNCAARLIDNEGFNTLKNFGVMDGDTEVL